VATAAVTTTAVAAAAASVSFQDLVVRADPRRPPHSLPLLVEQLRAAGVRVFASTHVHSNAAGVDGVDRLRHFLRVDPLLERRGAQLAITLVWCLGRFPNFSPFSTHVTENRTMG